MKYSSKDTRISSALSKQTNIGWTKSPSRNVYLVFVSCDNRVLSVRIANCEAGPSIQYYRVPLCVCVCLMNFNVCSSNNNQLQQCLIPAACIQFLSIEFRLYVIIANNYFILNSFAAYPSFLMHSVKSNCSNGWSSCNRFVCGGRCAWLMLFSGKKIPLLRVLIFCIFFFDFVYSDSIQHGDWLEWNVNKDTASVDHGPGEAAIGGSQ